MDYAKLVVCLAFSVTLIASKRYHWALPYLALGYGTELLDAYVFAHITPPQILGACYVLLRLNTVLRDVRTRPGRVLLLVLLSAASTGFVYGFLVPWPDTTGERPWTQQAHGRAAIYTARMVTDFGIALFMIELGRYRDALRFSLLVAIGAGLLATAGVVLEETTNIDFFGIAFPDRPSWDAQDMGRNRGFNGEPRTSGFACAAGLLASTLGILTTPQALVVVAALFLGLLLTTSTSAIAVVLLGFAVRIVAAPSRRYMQPAVALLVIAALSVGAFSEQITTRWAQFVRPRALERDAHIREPGIVGALRGKLEVFDASALGFFAANPEYLLIGAGPGLVSLPASDYVPPGVMTDIYGSRIDSVPHTGVLRALSDGGLIAVGLWVLLIALLWRSLRATRCPSTSESSHAGLSWFLAFAAINALQAKPFWYVVLGYALAQTATARRAEFSALHPSAGSRR